MDATTEHTEEHGKSSLAAFEGPAMEWAIGVCMGGARGSMREVLYPRPSVSIRGSLLPVHWREFAFIRGSSFRLCRPTTEEDTEA